MDLAEQHRCLRTVVRMAAGGTGVLAIMYDINLAAQYATRVVLVRNGEMLGACSPSEALTAALIWDTFAFAAKVIPHPEPPIPLVVPAGRPASLR